MVLHPKAEVFSNPNGNKKREGINAIILRIRDLPNNSYKSLVLPTTHSHYKKGEIISWEWNFELEIEQSWYKDPDTGEIVPAWGQSKEFIGRDIEEIPKLEDI